MSNMPTAQIAQINGNSLAFYEWGEQGSTVLICLHSNTHYLAGISVDTGRNVHAQDRFATAVDHLDHITVEP